MNILIQRNLPEIKELMLKFGVMSAYLFARKQMTKCLLDSDMDFLVAFNLT